MSEVELRQLRPGMVLTEDAYTKSGSQLVLPKGTVLDEQRIARLAFYGVAQVNAITREQAQAQLLQSPVPAPKPVAPAGTAARPAQQAPAAGTAAAPSQARPAAAPPSPAPDENASFSERLRATPEFKKFKMNFEDTFITYQRSINDIVSGDKDIEPEKLTEPVYDLIHSCYGPSNVFDMLHALRGYDDATYVHSVNVALIAHTIGEWMHLEADDLALLTEAGLLLDIGKLLVPQEILNKKGPLTTEERVKLRMHPQLGFRVIETKHVDRHVKNTVLMHHERCDGSGYPRHLKMDQIDPVARVVSIADVYDAMTCERVYRGALSPFYAFEQIEDEGLQKYDTRAVLTFLENLSGVYIGNRVRLSDGSEGEIVYINKNRFSCPTVKVGSQFVDLFARRDLHIEALL